MLCGICFHILHSLTSSRNGTTNRCRWSPVTPYVCAIDACWTRGLTRGLSGTSLHRVSVQDLSQWQKYIIYCNDKNIRFQVKSIKHVVFSRDDRAYMYFKFISNGSDLLLYWSTYHYWFIDIHTNIECCTLQILLPLPLASTKVISSSYLVISCISVELLSTVQSSQIQ